jgi:hypothetical protein
MTLQSDSKVFRDMNVHAESLIAAAACLEKRCPQKLKNLIERHPRDPSVSAEIARIVFEYNSGNYACLDEHSND